MITPQFLRIFALTQQIGAVSGEWGKTLKANNIWSTVCETNSRSTHRRGQNYLSGDAEYSIEKQTDVLLPEAVSLPDHKRQQVTATALARSTRRLRRVTSRSHHAQGSIRFEFVKLESAWVHWNQEEAYTLYLECFITYISKCSLLTPLLKMVSIWYWIFDLNDMWLFFMSICQWHQIYSIKEAVLFSNGICPYSFFFPVQWSNHYFKMTVYHFIRSS